MLPTNSTNLSLAGIFKWMFIISSLPLLIHAKQGLIDQVAASGAPSRRGNVGELLTGADAQAKGWQALQAALICWAIAWALWFFIQRREED